MDVVAEILNKVGVMTTDENGEERTCRAIMEDLVRVWDTLEEPQQHNLAYEILSQ